jgi:hypothetical protein
MSEYPIMTEGERVGTLKVEREGLMTVFDASAADNGELFRISVYGGGGEGYLGMMWPENGVLRLVKRLSRAAMAEFPAEIEYAGPSGRRGDSGTGTAPEKAPKALLGTPVPKTPAETRVPKTPAETPVPKTPAETPIPKTPVETPSTEGECETLWFSAPDGTLSTFDGERLLIALPADNAITIPKGAEGAIRNINGREYIVFPR